MNTRRFNSIVFIILVSFTQSFAGPSEIMTPADSLVPVVNHSFRQDSSFSFRSPKGFVPSLIHNFGEQAAAPFHMNGKQALMVAGGVAITTALFFADEEIDHYFKPLKEKHEWINRSSPVVTEIGGTYGLAFVGAFGCYSLIGKDWKAFQTTLLSLQAAITSGVWVRIGKMLTGRERPSATYTDFHCDYWWGPVRQYNSGITNGRGVAYFDAFPSGHTATIFSIATVFAHQYSDRKFVPAIAYSIASMVGVTRLSEHTHWGSDVFAGACIGYLCGKQVVKHARKLEGSSSTSSVLKNKPQWFFSPSADGLGIDCVLSF